MGMHDSQQVRRLLSVAVGADNGTKLETFFSLLEGEEENDINTPPDVDELAAARANGAEIGARIEKNFDSGWSAATVRRYANSVGHLLEYDDGLCERVHLDALRRGSEWRLLPPPQPPRKKPRTAAPAAPSAASSSSSSAAAKSAEQATARAEERHAREAAEERRLVLTPMPSCEAPLPHDSSSSDEPPAWRPAPASHSGQGHRVRVSERHGWAQLQGLDVRAVKQWLRDEVSKSAISAEHMSPSRGKHRVGARRAADRAGASGPHWAPWGGRNSNDPRVQAEKGKKDRWLLLNRSEYPLLLRQFFINFFLSSPAEKEFGHPDSYPSVPECILQLDTQLKGALPGLFGSDGDGDFVLAYAQVTRMCTGNQIEDHVDSSHFGDVIVTVGLTGTADVLIKKASEQKLGAQPGTQRAVPSVPGWLRVTTIGEGDAYIIHGIGRYRYTHGVFSSPTDANAPEFGPSVSRVGLTLRYFRRSFCDIGTRRILLEKLCASSPVQWALPLTAPEERARARPPAPAAPNTIIDVEANVNNGKNPFSYPALVLGSFVRRLPKKHGGSKEVLLVQYLCDRRTPSLAMEALEEIDDVSGEMGVRSSEATIRRCCEEHPELAGRLRTAVRIEEEDE